VEAGSSRQTCDLEWSEVEAGSSRQTCDLAGRAAARGGQAAVADRCYAAISNPLL